MVRVIAGSLRLARRSVMTAPACIRLKPVKRLCYRHPLHANLVQYFYNPVVSILCQSDIVTKALYDDRVNTRYLQRNHDMSRYP